MTREEAIRMLSNRDAHGVPCGYTSGYQETFDMAIEALQYLQEWGDILQGKPVKHGKWIEENDGWYGGQGCRCSSCGYGYSYKAYHEPYEFDFCPNCGAKMDGGK